MSARERTIEVIVEHSVKNNDDVKGLKQHVDVICNINDWERINDQEIFDVCKRLSFSYLRKSFDVIKNSVENRELSKRLNSYARRFPELEEKFIKENA